VHSKRQIHSVSGLLPHAVNKCAVNARMEMIYCLSIITNFPEW